MAKHIIALLAFEVVAILPVILIIYWVQGYAGGFSWEAKSFNKFNYHPVFMIIGFCFVMGHALLSFRILPLQHRLKKYIHAALNIIAAIFITVGLVAVFEFHADHKFPDFYSIHSWLGMATVVLFGLQLLGGLSIFQDLVRGASNEVRGVYKPLHIAAGLIIVMFAAGTMCTGLQEKYQFTSPGNWSGQAYLLRFVALSIFLWAGTLAFILLTVEKNAPEAEYSEIPDESASINHSR